MTTIDRLHRWIVEHARWPLTWRTTADRDNAALHEQIYVMRKRHEQELLEERKRVDTMVARLSELRWSYEHDGAHSGAYRVTLLFDPRLLTFHYGYCDQRELEILGDYFAREVKAHIVTSRFLRDARQADRDDRRRGPVR